ncbi:MAG TPA: flagellar basal-body rod protein FlgG [Polyangiaceae bacterium]|nr:flagellar basal-body rod protein FlgG [Polyangiaceae bacterium]
MFRALHAAATGMQAQQTNIDVIANNMANVNTTGFKKSRAEFQDLLYQTIRAPGGQTGTGASAPAGLQVGLGVRTAATQALHAQGTLQQTSNPLDIAIEGNGFFQVQRPNGDMAYTRAGNLKTDADGRLVTSDGFPIEPTITIPVDATNITISSTGMISVTQPNQANAVEVGQLQIANFANPGGLLSTGRNLYTATAASGQAFIVNPGEQGTGSVSQGFLEGSNVEVVNEMIDLIASQRAYEVNQRVVTAADEMLRKTSER